MAASNCRSGKTSVWVCGTGWSVVKFRVHCDKCVYLWLFVRNNQRLQILLKCEIMKGQQDQGDTQGIQTTGAIKVSFSVACWGSVS